MGLLRKLAVPALSLLAFLCAPARAAEVQFQSGHWTAASAPAKGTPAGDLALIRQALRDKQPKRAIKRADRFVEKHPQDAGVEEAMYLGAQGQMDRGWYWQAYERFEKQISRFPAGDLLRRATSREADIARAFLAGKKRLVWGFLPLSARAEGVSIMERVIARVSGTELAAQCLTELADYYFNRKKWAEAALSYDRFTEMFAGQYDTSRAEYLAGLAHFNSFRGIAFEDTPLLEARQRFKSFVTKYPNHARADSALTYLTKIEDLLAEKSHWAGGFYARIGQPRAAAYYYKLVARLYPDTPWAQRSLKDASRLKLPPPQGEPSAPAQTPGVEAVP
jgi:outer membrane protein assembly factor BamD (BamD/ComL family)